MINNYKLIDTLSDLCTKDDIISPGMSGIGVCQLLQAWKVKFGQRFTFAGALGAMGSEPMAIGACIATGKRTICLTGDGGFQMNFQELEIVRREKLPIKYFVINNGGYGSIVNTQNKYFEGRYVGSTEKSGLTLPSLKKIADVYDLKYYLLENEKDVQSICKQALAGQEPCIVEVIESVDQETVMRVGTRMENGKPVSGTFATV
jgi:acetolactate synthase-1/2/3 large subunit